MKYLQFSKSSFTESYSNFTYKQLDLIESNQVILAQISLNFFINVYILLFNYKLAMDSENIENLGNQTMTELQVMCLSCVKKQHSN